MVRRFNQVAVAIFLLCVISTAAFPQSGWRMQPAPIETRWAKDVSPTNALPEYPRPQMVRKQWQNLNGLWSYAIAPKDAAQPAAFDGQILVPYPIESALSGVQKPLLPDQRLWYRRSLQRPDFKRGERVLLHFGAVDWHATVYLNGKEIGQHRGGYQSFSLDVTGALRSGVNELTVAVHDPTNMGVNPHGKQVLEPKGIWYTASSGIWQTVWLETVPAAHISGLSLIPDVDNNRLNLEVDLVGDVNGYEIVGVAKSGKVTVGTVQGEAGTALEIRIPRPRLWSPDDPFLYDLSVRLMKNGKVVDTVGSYFGMRKIEVKKDGAGIDRIFLNNKYTYNLGVLDQGFWPEGLHTAPTDEALRFDVEAIKGMGFNTIRKHIKIEPARWYYWCDRLGMLVWQDMPQPGKKSPDGRTAFEAESAANIRQLYNHPSIVTWVLFNESWALYEQERLTKWMKGLDGTRLVNGHSGEYINEPPAGADVKSMWAGSDMTDIHAYPDPKLPPLQEGKARVLGEFGGVGVLVSGHQWDDLNGWGYVKTSAGELAAKYEAMTVQLKKMEAEGLSASIYTQPFDVETEANGLLTYDRKILKMPLAKIRRINSALVSQTGNFAVASSEVAALPVAYPSPEHEYQALLKEYVGGRRDLNFLRRMAVLAKSLKHQDIAKETANQYVRGVSGDDRYVRTHIQFCREFTEGSKDRCFDLFYGSGDKVDRIMDLPGYSREFADYIIAKEEIDSLLFPGGKPRPDSDWRPDWDIITATITRKYDAAYADRTVIGAKVRWYNFKKDWPEYTRNLVTKINKYGAGAEPFVGIKFVLNNSAWDVFQYSSEKEELSSAISWMRHVLEPGFADPAEIDTYANLLYKSGKTTEGIEWQKKAVQIAKEKQHGELKTFEETLSKMEKGEPTWPVPSANVPQSP